MEGNALKHAKIVRSLTATNVSKNVRPAKRTIVVAAKKNVIKTNARNYIARTLKLYALNAKGLFAKVVELTVKHAKRSSV